MRISRNLELSELKASVISRNLYCRWLQIPQAGRKESERPEDPPNLYECTVCLEIVHPQCAEKNGVGLGQVNPDLSK